MSRRTVQHLCYDSSREGQKRKALSLTLTLIRPSSTDTSQISFTDQLDATQGMHCFLVVHAAVMHTSRLSVGCGALRFYFSVDAYFTIWMAPRIGIKTDSPHRWLARRLLRPASDASHVRKSSHDDSFTKASKSPRSLRPPSCRLIRR